MKFTQEALKKHRLYDRGDIIIKGRFVYSPENSDSYLVYHFCSSSKARAIEQNVCTGCGVKVPKKVRTLQAMIEFQKARK